MRHGFRSLITASMALSASLGFAFGAVDRAASAFGSIPGSWYAQSDSAQRSASRDAQARTGSHLRVPYTPMSQGDRDRLPSFKVSAQRSHTHSPGTRQRRRRQMERRTRGGGK